MWWRTSPRPSTARRWAAPQVPKRSPTWCASCAAATAASCRGRCCTRTAPPISPSDEAPMPRRLALVLAGLLTVLPIGHRGATAQELYKGKTITIICGYGVGGGYDLYARLLARHLADHI